MSQRIEKLRNRLAEADVDTLMISNQENRRYLSGFTGTDGQFDETAGALFIGPEKLVLATDGRYTLQAIAEAADFEVITYAKGLPQALPGILVDLSTRRLGFEAERLSVAQLEKCRDAVNSDGSNVELVPTTDWVESIRVVKDDMEIDRTRKALDIAENAFRELLPNIKPGMTEKEIAWKMEIIMREAGSDGLAFPLIVASGPNSALPHAVPGDRPVKPSEPILFDWGARFDGYCSDTSRTVVLGAPDETFLSAYQTVRQAQALAIAAIKPELNGKAVDAVARNTIERAGYTGKFNHGLGHGTGLAIHEQPRLGPTSDAILKPGMICTIEPGIYLPDWGGIRLENQVVVTTNGAEVLNHLGFDDYIISPQS